MLKTKEERIMYYKECWRKRKKELIIVSIIFAIIAIGYVVEGGSLKNGLLIWVIGSWLLATIVSCFSKSGGGISSMIGDFVGGIFSGFAAAAGSPLGIILCVFYMGLVLIKFIILYFMIVFQAIAYPITTIYYFLRSRQ